MFQEYETLSLEIEELKKGIASGQQEVEKCVANIEQFKKDVEALTEQASQAKVGLLLYQTRGNQVQAEKSSNS